jgi:hypothetical protein
MGKSKKEKKSKKSKKSSKEKQQKSSSDKFNPVLQSFAVRLSDNSAKFQVIQK